MALPSGPTICLPGPQTPAAPLQVVDTISPTTGEIARLPALVVTDPRLASLDPDLLSRAAEHWKAFAADYISFLTGELTDSQLASAGAAFWVGAKALKPNTPDPAPHAAAERVMADFTSASQQSKAMTYRQECLALGRLLVAWGICEHMPSLSKSEYVSEPWRYELNPMRPGSLIVYRRHPNNRSFILGPCVTGPGELSAARAALEAEFATKQAARNRPRLAVTTGDQPAPAEAAARIDAEIAQMKQAAFLRGVTNYAEQRAAR